MNRFQDKSYSTRFVIGGLPGHTDRNTICITGIILFDNVKYFKFIPELSMFFFINKSNQLFAIFGNNGIIFYTLIEHNAKKIYFPNNKKNLVIVEENSVTMYSIQKIFDKFMDYQIEIEIMEITGINSGKQYYEIPHKEEVFLFKKILNWVGKLGDNLIYRHDCLIVGSVVKETPDILEMTIVCMNTNKFHTFRIESDQFSFEKLDNQIYKLKV
jgi:hypothetical protein